jgi:hypothetical protein
VFDNDGTLWIEQPVQERVLFSQARAAEMAQADRSPIGAGVSGLGAFALEGYRGHGAKACTTTVARAPSPSSMTIQPSR